LAVNWRVYRTEGEEVIGKLVFEDIVDINTPHPYVFVYLLADDEIFSVSGFSPFMELAVQENKSLSMTIFESIKTVSLSAEQWDEISKVPRDYHKETLENDDD
jgi:hypothetical protein